MHVGVLGTGMAGQALGAKLVELGHEVMMGARQAGNEKAVAWAEEAGPAGSQGSFADAASFGEIIVNATAGMASLDALGMAGAERLRDKVLIDVANPLQFAPNAPPSLSICNTDSLGEQIQRAFPEARVVKTLNTINHEVMVQPSLVPGPHNVFLSGNDAAANTQVGELLQSFGWPAAWIVDLGDTTTARGPEMYLILWLSLLRAIGSAEFNIDVRRG